MLPPLDRGETGVQFRKIEKAHKRVMRSKALVTFKGKQETSRERTDGGFHCLLPLAPSAHEVDDKVR
jgi:hypothetical protein